MNAPVKPLHRRTVITDEGRPVVFETDTGDLIVIPHSTRQGVITLQYEFHPRIPELTKNQRN